MRFVNNSFFAIAVFLAQRKNKPRRHINISRFYMLLVKIKLRLNFLTLVDFLFLCFLALIIYELGLGDKESWEST